MSILDNVRMGREDASDAEVIQALKDAMCWDIIEKLPEGINTVIQPFLSAITSAATPPPATAKP